MYSNRPIKEIVDDFKNNKELVFVHTPKCGGTYTSYILKHLQIKNISHLQATPMNNRIYFTIVRNPINRFESMLNYRLDTIRNRHNWPVDHLKYVFDDRTINLNDILSKMTDEDILSFKPYNTLTYWSKNVDIIITIDNLPKLLNYFGYKYDINKFHIANVSNKIRGTLNNESIERLKIIFKDDIELYNKVINSTIEPF